MNRAEEISVRILHFRERDSRNDCIRRCITCKDMTSSMKDLKRFSPIHLHLQEFHEWKQSLLCICWVTCESWHARMENVLEQFWLCWNTAHSCVRLIDVSRKKNCSAVFFHSSIFLIERTWTRETLEKFLLRRNHEFQPGSNKAFSRREKFCYSKNFNKADESFITACAYESRIDNFCLN